MSNPTVSKRIKYDELEIKKIEIILESKTELLENCILRYYVDKAEINIEIIHESKSYGEFVKKSIISNVSKVIILEIENGIVILTFNSKEDSEKLMNWILETEEFQKQNQKQNQNQNQNLEKNLTIDSFKIELFANKNIGFNSREYLKDTLNNMIRMYLPHFHDGPYTVVYQSSGFGKSRACLSLFEDFYIVYCCLGNTESNEYPRRSSLADGILKSESKDKREIYYKCYFNTFIDLLNEQNLDCKTFFQNYDHEKNLVKDLVENKLKITNYQTPFSKYKLLTPIIFVFDESNELLKNNDNFFILINLLSKLDKDIFVLFVDSISPLNELMQNSVNRSLGTVFKLCKLFEPIYLLPNWDIFVNYDSIKNMEDTVKFENVCKFGRPLWGSWIYTEENLNEKYGDFELKNLYFYAVSKLIGGKSFDSQLKYNDNLAILSTRIGVIKPKCLKTRQILVSNNMAVCNYIDYENNLFEIDYPSEPFLADCGAYLMNYLTGYYEPIKKLIFSIEYVFLSLNEKCETIAKLILLYSKDNPLPVLKCQFTFFCLNCTYVGNFLQRIFVKSDHNCGNIENG